MSSFRNRSSKKTYAMGRMITALERAIRAPTVAESDRASRWATAWGMIAGIRGKGVRLRRYNLPGQDRRQTSRY